MLYYYSLSHIVKTFKFIFIFIIFFQKFFSLFLTTLDEKINIYKKEKYCPLENSQPSRKKKMKNCLNIKTKKKMTKNINVIFV